MTCKPTRAKPRKGKVKVTCKVRLKAAAAGRVSARLSRSGRVYARGGARARGRVLRFRSSHAIRRGRYVLTMAVAMPSGERLVLRQRVRLRQPAT